ncbi:MAG: phosphotransferase family protein [Christensenellales bacterium]
MRCFPKTIGWHNWGAIMCDTELFAPLVAQALARHDLPSAPIEAGYPGTHAVFRAGECVVKLYAPLDLPDAYAEVRAYRASRALPMLPRLLGEGILQAGGYDWTYLITRHVPGVAAREVWAGLSPAARRHAMRALGAWSRAYHALPDPFAQPSPLSAAGFVRGRAGMVEKNAAALAEHPAFLELARANLDALMQREPITLLHADLTEDHLIIDGARYHVIDLADSRMGLESAEWLCVYFELARMDTDAFFEYIEASGRNWDAHARMDMMSCALLHGFGASILNSWGERTGRTMEQLFPEV